MINSVIVINVDDASWTGLSSADLRVGSLFLTTSCGVTLTDGGLWICPALLGDVILLTSTSAFSFFELMAY
jgi:hypothetical protein